jgi:hypothetical protein
MTIPTIQGLTTRASLVAVGSVISVNTGGQAGASTLSFGTPVGTNYSGLPIMGIQNRAFVISTGNATAISARVEVKVNQQTPAV